MKTLRHRLVHLLGSLLLGFRLLWAGRRLWLSMALLGALLGTLWGARPRVWQAEGALLLRPLFLREGYLLAMQDLGPYYARRLIAPERVARAARAASPSGPLPHVQATALAGGKLRLRVVDPDPRRAEALLAVLLTDFQAELLAENRQREESDRLVVEFAPLRPTDRLGYDPRLLAGAGLLGGALLGMSLALLRGWRQRLHVVGPHEVYITTGAPLLAAIPSPGGKLHAHRDAV